MVAIFIVLNVRRSMEKVRFRLHKPLDTYTVLIVPVKAHDRNPPDTNGIIET